MGLGFKTRGAIIEAKYEKEIIEWPKSIAHLKW